MKYFLLIIFLLTGCRQPTPVNPGDISPVTSSSINFKDEEGKVYKASVKKFVFEDHRYLIIDGSLVHDTTIIHDPNCWCSKPK